MRTTRDEPDTAAEYPASVTPTSRGDIPGHAPAGVTGIWVRIDWWAALASFPGGTYFSLDDGEPDRMSRGGEYIPVKPGWHKVRCYIPLVQIFLVFCGLVIPPFASGSREVTLSRCTGAIGESAVLDEDGSRSCLPRKTHTRLLPRTATR